MRLLKHIINSDKREYIIEHVNAPLLEKIVLLGKKYDEPTHENVLHPNTHILLDIRDGFFKCWKTTRSRALYESLWRILIVKYEHSPNWRHMLDWAIMMIAQNIDWQPFNYNRQMSLWIGERK